MIVQVFFRDILKEFYFQNILDGRHVLNIYSHETDLKDDIEIIIDVNNGIRHINEKNITIVDNGDGEEDIAIIKNDRLLLAKIKNINENIGILLFESNKGVTDFNKYIVDSNYIDIGKNGKIEYNIKNNIKRFFALSYEDSKVYVIPYINRIYHSGKLLREKSRIRFGDTISYNKLKLVYLGNVIALNNPDGYVVCSLDTYKYEETGYVKSSVLDNATEGDKKLFTRSPRITHKPIDEARDIDPPTAKKEPKEKPLIYTIGSSLTMSLAMIVNVVYMIRASSSGRSPIPSALMAFSMLMGATLWPILTRRYNKSQAEKEEAKRIEKYKAYIDSVDKELEENANYNRQIYEELYPSLESLVRCALKKDRALWNHTPSEEGFLDVRIGRGARKFAVDINIQKERFSLEDDPLKKYASVIQQKYKYLHNVPVSVDLNDTDILGIIGERSRQLDLIKLIITRLSVTHCYDEVKFAVIFNRKEYDLWEFTKWLPHCWSDNKSIRYIADNRDGAYYVMSHLREIYNDRLETIGDKNVNYLPHYVVFITDYSLVSGDTNIQSFIENSDGLGFTFVLGYDTLGRLPNNCQNIIQLSSEECTIYNKADNSGKMLSFVPDISEGTDVRKIAEALASVKISKISEETQVPERLSFFGLYKAKNIEDLVIERRWKESQSYKSLEAPIGMGSNDEVFALNIHEKYHGPHGLIAGTTGSGKSEFIQSLILSMAINYHPYDVSFVLIDYKGGGMANAFTKLPHVSGTITNLEGNQIKRSLISLKSELKRRQAIFKEYHVNHIDSYQIKYKRGLASEPLPHLVIVSDEFAELKSQEPEFMNELISTARIGRSLGVHLILATQKPSGVVNDQIWSNTRFRICLKVADRTDSKEMLKRDEAATITLPGRCYVQVGNDEIFKLIQSGYSGEKYVRNGSNIADSSNLSITCIDLQGSELYKSNQKANDIDTEETQLSAIVDYIDKYSTRQGIVPLKLWLPPLPKELYLENLDKRVGGFNGNCWEPGMDWIDPIIGLYDEPENQKQNVLDVNFGQNGHFILYGAPGTGKTTFLQTLIYALAQRYSPELVNMYVLDFGSRSLSYCKFLPHVADVMFSDDEDKIKKLFSRINIELGLRKKALAEYGVGNLLSYMQASNNKLPAIILIIDNFAAFIELYQSYENELIKLSREGGNYGIYLVITSASVNAVKRRIAENIKMVYTLQLNDVYDYASIIGRTEGVYPENVKGRGLVRIGSVLEFHTALAVKEVNEAERVKLIKEKFNKMADCWNGPVPKPLPIMPEDMSIDSVVLRDEYVDAIENGKIPVGYEIENVELAVIDPCEIPVFNVYGEGASGKTNFLSCIIKANKYRDIWLIDNSEGSIKKICSENDIAAYSGSPDDLSEFIGAFVKELLNRHNEYKAYCDNGGDMPKNEFIKKYKELILIIDDFDSFFTNISDIDLAYFKRALQESGDLGVTVFVALNINLISKYKTQSRQIFDSKNGIVLGAIDKLSIYNISVSYGVKKNYTVEAGKGFLVNGNKYLIIKVPSVFS
ncbi:MAG: type VII secretion protein EssC [Lachnospirales bacterium]